MGAIFSLAFLLTDYEWFTELLRSGLEFGWMLLGVLCAAAVGDAFQRLLRR